MVQGDISHRIPSKLNVVDRCFFKLQSGYIRWHFSLRRFKREVVNKPAISLVTIVGEKVQRNEDWGFTSCVFAQVDSGLGPIGALTLPGFFQLRPGFSQISRDEHAAMVVIQNGGCINPVLECKICRIQLSQIKRRSDDGAVGGAGIFIF
ncbi:hypothetical protein SDC9_158414 [bioreactor metagenome]|uniref:Uncharacterized protein n=1 Tax=bioreactor metagenome TaxID=1076179 RepID=A0A645FFG1_9ZZZZ